jgi:hypothetical protein
MDAGTERSEEVRIEGIPRPVPRIDAMKTISIMQPWASLIVRGKLSVETRGWSRRYRGPLAIWASKGRTEESTAIFHDEQLRSVLQSLGYARLEDMPTGVIVGVVLLANIQPTQDLTTSLPDYERELIKPGQIGWLLTNPTCLENPPEVPGQGPFFDTDDDLILPQLPPDEVEFWRAELLKVEGGSLDTVGSEDAVHR